MRYAPVCMQQQYNAQMRVCVCVRVREWVGGWVCVSECGVCGSLSYINTRTCAYAPVCMQHQYNAQMQVCVCVREYAACGSLFYINTRACAYAPVCMQQEYNAQVNNETLFDSHNSTVPLQQFNPLPW